jgi:nucleobase:cation symporter-1, NCS1 family
MAFFVGFFISFVTFCAINFFFPPEKLGEFDEIDKYGTFTASEAARLGIVPTETANDAEFGDLKGDAMETVVADGPGGIGHGQKPWWHIRRA